MQRYPNPLLIVIDAYAAMLSAWLGVAMVLAAVVDVLLDARGSLFYAFLALAVFAGLGHVGFAFAHKCPECGKHPTIQGFAPPHASAAHDGDGAWARVVRDVIHKRSFTCFHCGSSFDVSDAA